MALTLRVSKLCVLLTGSKLEAGRGLEVLHNELTEASDARQLLLAFLTQSPQLVELAALLGCSANQHAAMGCYEAAMAIENTEGRLYPVIHAALTEHLPTWTLWLSGDRGAKNCAAALTFFTAVNKFSHALLYHRFKVVVKGPWIGPEVAWKKHRERQRAADKKLREAGLNYLLSFIECGDTHGVATAVGTPQFLVSLCGTLADDAPEMQRRVVLAVSQAMQCVSVHRSQRAHAFERKGVASNVLLLVPQHPWAEAEVVDNIIPALAVPEVRYSLAAKVIPNQVLLHVLRHVHPHKFLPHRRVVRKVLSLAPSLAVPYLAYLRDSLPVATAGGTLETLAALDVIMVVLEAPLPAAFARGSMAMTTGAAAAAAAVDDDSTAPPSNPSAVTAAGFVLSTYGDAPPQRAAGASSRKRKQPGADAAAAASLGLRGAAVSGGGDVVMEAAAAADAGANANAAAAATATKDVDDSFLLTPERVADVILPVFVGSALQLLLKKGSGMVALHVLQCFALGVRKLRAVAVALRAMERRARLFSVGVGGAGAQAGGVVGFLRSVHRLLLGRLPAASAVLDAAVGAGFTNVTPAATLYLTERKLLTLRLLQDEIPLYLAGVSLAKLYTPVLAAAPAEPRDTDTRLVDLDGALSTLSPPGVMLLLQLTMHDAGLKVTALTNNAIVDLAKRAEGEDGADANAHAAAKSKSKSSLMVTSPLLEIVVCYHRLARVLAADAALAAAAAYRGGTGATADAPADAPPSKRRKQDKKGKKDTATKQQPKTSAETPPDAPVLARADALLALQHACVLVVEALCACTLAVEGRGRVPRAEVTQWIAQCTTVGDALFLCDLLQKMYGDALSAKGGGGGNEADTAASPLMRTAVRAKEKHAAAKDDANANKAAAFPHTAYIARVERALAADAGVGGTAAALPTQLRADWGVYDPLAAAAPASKNAAAATAGVSTTGVETSDDPAAAVYNVLAQYNGTLSKEDQEMFMGDGGVLACLPFNDYKAGPLMPKHPSRPGPDPLWLQLLATSLTDRRIQKTLQDYPVSPADVADDAARVDPRYVTVVLAAHFALCSSREPVTVPEIRRLCLQGLIPLLIRGLSSRDDFVKEHAYTGLAALRQVTPDASPFSMLLEHVRNTCWKPLCRLPNGVAAFFAAAADALFRPGLPVHGAVTRYLLRFPYTRRGDLPLSDVILKPAERGTASLMFILNVVHATIRSMATGKCGKTIGTLVATGALPACLGLLQNPLTPEQVRDAALRVLEAAAAVTPTVILLKQRMLAPLVMAAVHLQPSATGDLRTIVITKNWDARTRLVRCVVAALNCVSDEFDATQVKYDNTVAYTALVMAVLQLGDEVTDVAAGFFPACLRAAHLLAVRIGHAALPPRAPDMQTRLVALCKAHRMTAPQRGAAGAAADDAAALAGALLGVVEAAEKKAA